MPQEQMRNAFVIGLDDANLPMLRQVPGAGSLRFHQLLTIEELQVGEVHPPALGEEFRRARRIEPQARAAVRAHQGERRKAG